MQQGHSERRRGRRIDLQVPLLIRRTDASNETFDQQVTKNVSLAGVYFETDDHQTFTMNETVIASVSVPESHTREFPFTRLAGRGRVVRIKSLPSESDSGKKRPGIALEFGEDITALTAIPHR